MASIKLTRILLALKTIKDSYKTNPSDLERDGLIQRFEYTLEICWRSSQKILEVNGIRAETPKQIIREMAQVGWIKNAERWLTYIDARNKTSHIYHKEVAEELFALIPGFIKDVEDLAGVLETKKE